MLVKVTEDLVKLVITKPEELEIKELSSGYENEVFIKVMVSSEDYDQVISVISSIKTLVQAASHNDNDKKVKIEVDKF
ncbi:MAG: hypothetical protein HXK72_00315 [Clostridiales bacterium]|nr:hypothetical protein [Clostridiales bacterium]